MFTGLIQELGTVTLIRPITEGIELSIKAPQSAREMKVDDSVAVNGVCQTAVKVEGDVFVVQAVTTTLEKTTLGQMKKDDKVNLELCLRLSDRLGGHLVQGHVNGVAKILAIQKNGKNLNVTFNLSQKLMRYILSEGSVAIDGVSLTVAQANHDQSTMTVTIIPHTLDHTLFHFYTVGSMVNVEVDMLAKYVEQMLKLSKNEKAGIDLAWPQSKGF